MACRSAAHCLKLIARGACCRSLTLALIVPLILAVLAHRAHADVAYVCDGGRVVNVRSGELEQMKRTDPCIAGYHGLQIAPPSPPPLPERNPRLASLDASSAEVASPMPPAAPASVSTIGLGGSLTAPRVERVVFTHALPGNRRLETASTATAPVDFRRVPIINAQPGDSAIFFHTR